MEKFFFFDRQAARLMMAYPDKVTCDKETFLRSKLDQEYFKLLEPTSLKGIAKPGPVYEFNKLLALVLLFSNESIKRV